MALITPSKFISLKAAVKAECLRRNQQGSVAAYGGAAYDFSRTPLTDQTIIQEFYSKIATPINAIDGATPTSGNKIITDSDLDTMRAKVDTLAAKPMAPNSSNTGCAASCTGLCYAGCAGTCTSCTSCDGCSGSCWDVCTSCTSCTGTCSTVCARGCATLCTGHCAGGCEDNCASNCTGTCTGCGSGCAGYCTGDCTGSCVAGCGGSCGGCSGSCTGVCGGSCTAYCSDTVS